MYTENNTLNTGFSSGLRCMAFGKEDQYIQQNPAHSETVAKLVCCQKQTYLYHLNASFPGGEKKEHNY